VIAEGGISIKYIRSIEDECLYVGKDLTILVYVDDILLFSKSADTINKMKEALMS
jgi:hypothetical protein